MNRKLFFILALLLTVVTGAWAQTDLSELTGDYEAQNGDILTGTLGGNYKITIADGATVTLDGVTINGTSSDSYPWAGITCEGDATIILKDGSTNTVKGFYEDYPGIFVPESKTVTIKGGTAGTGTLTASSNGLGAGIGGGYDSILSLLSCGSIEIQGGNITATGGISAAGIGSGKYGSCGDITISGGTITATGGSSAPGIGPGYFGHCGNITITNDVTSVTAAKGGDATSSIGAGYDGTCGTVTIGGIVTGNISKSPYTFTPLTIPLTIEAITAGTVQVKSPKESMMYSKNGGMKITLTDNPTNIEVSAGDKVTFYGWETNINNYYGTEILGTGTGFQTKVYGNIMSLVDEVNFATATTIPSTQAFCGLFKGNTTLIDASQLQLPATTLTSQCYDNMFNGCTNLTTAPKLRATTLAQYCYNAMFIGCTGLTTAPELPATTMAGFCYMEMFKGCTNLTTAPELPATTLDQYCYSGMFNDCTNLTTAPALPATTLATSCYRQMFQGCTKLNSVTCLATNISASYATTNWLDGVAATGTFTKAEGMTGWPTGASGIPSGWTTVDYYKMLNESTDNSAWIAANDGETADIRLVRTLSATGWNSFCVPFDIPAAKWASYNITAVKKLIDSSLTGSTLTLTFGDEATSIEAGKAYLVKVSSAVANPTFDDVTISATATSTETTYADFVPAMNPTALAANDMTKLFVTGGTTLTWPKTAGSIKGFRAFFNLKGVSASSLNSISMDFGMGEVTSVDIVSGVKAKASNGATFDLFGRRINGEPVQRGVYIVNGQTVVK